MPIALAYGIVVLLVYGILRLGGNRLLSIAGAVLFATSPLVLFHLPSMRDFFRAPPILATILVCGYLVSRPLSRRKLLALSLLLGAGIGLGTGFRQDAIICLPAAAGIVLVFTRGTADKPLPWKWRMLAVLLLTGAFYVPARPAVKMTRDTGGNNAFYLLQGFSGSSMEALHTGRPSYYPIYSSSDYVVHGAICAYDNALHESERMAYNLEVACAKAFWRLQGIVMLPLMPGRAALPLILGFSREAFVDRGLAIWSYDAEQTARDILYRLAMTFPADIISKWYGAAVVCVRDTPVKDMCILNVDLAEGWRLEPLRLLHLRLAAHLERWGAWYALAALLVLSARNARFAFVLALLLCYFCGYTSLCFQWRHAFHLQFVAFWAPCLPAERLDGRRVEHSPGRDSCAARGGAKPGPAAPESDGRVLGGAGAAAVRPAVCGTPLSTPGHDRGAGPLRERGPRGY